MVIEFDPVGRQVMGMREDFVDNHFAVRGNVLSIVPAGRPAIIGAGTPLTARLHIDGTLPSGAKGQGETIAVSDTIPGAFIGDGFDRLSRRTAASDAELQEMVEWYRSRRTGQRNGLFHLQDELRAELITEEWTQVLEVLNRKASSVTSPTVTKG